MKSIKFLLVAMFVCLFTGGAVFATNQKSDQTDFQSIKLQLKNAGATWQADDTWYRQHSSDIKHLLGAKGVASNDVEFTIPSKQRTSDVAPQSVDWRSMNGQNYVSPILDQGNCGSCVAFASVATLETQMNIASFGSNLRFSPQALFACGGGACDFGWTLGQASDYLQQSGVPDEACLPYTSGMTGSDVECTAACSDSSQRSVHIVGYTTPTTGSKNIDAVKAALQNGPLLASFLVYDDFLFYKSGVYKHATGNVAGGHAISIIGYDDAQQAWIIRNSWGETWGMKGFAFVSYDDISGIGNDTFSFEAPKVEGFVTIRNPTDKLVVSDQVKIQTESTFASLKKVDLSVVDSNKAVKVSQSFAAAKGEVTLDTKTLADGRYEAVATATYGSNQTSESQHQYFYIQNTVPTLGLKFDPNGFDITQPLNGRVVFNIHEQSGVSPMTELNLVVKSGGNVVYTKTTKNTLQEMTMGWRTGIVPNGSYEIYMTGKLTVSAHDYTAESNHYTVTVQN